MTQDQLNEMARSIYSGYQNGDHLPRVTVKAIEGCHALAKLWGFKCTVLPPPEAVRLAQQTDGGYEDDDSVVYEDDEEDDEDDGGSWTIEGGQQHR